MFGRNLRFYRLRNNLSQQALADSIGVEAMSISNYENGKRQPSYETVNKIANALGVRVGSLMANVVHNEVLVTGNLRASGLGPSEFAYVEDYISRSTQNYLAINEWLGIAAYSNKNLLSSSILSNDDINAAYVRNVLGLAPQGPIASILSIIENLGIYIVEIDNVSNSFSGYATRGAKTGLNIIAINGNMSPVRKRFTLLHEFIHILYNDSTDEKTVDDISGRVLLPADDLKRELGIKRHRISVADIRYIHDEYGASANCIALRAFQEGIISRNQYYEYRDIRIGCQSIPDERPSRLNQLVCRAVNEGVISLSKAAELLGISYSDAENLCYGDTYE